MRTRRTDRTQRLIVVGDAAFVVVPEQPDQAAIAARVLRVEPDRLAIIRRRAVEFLGVAIDIAAIDVGEHARIDPDLGAVIFQRARILALLVEDPAAVIERLGVTWIDLERRREIRDGAIEIALAVPGAAAVFVGGREARVEPDSLVEIGKRGIEFALLVRSLPRMQ
jgi:hypothetical protein